jgi:SAM-dependent methyltransferase
VGAGHGSFTKVLCDGLADRWVGLEPDPELAARLDRSIAHGELPSCCRAVVGTITALEPGDTFDTILYMDVLEHIEDDGAELARAAAHLRPGGHVIVLSPAHGQLYTPFDEAIGHYRRYGRRMLRAAAPESLEPVRVVYLDSVGMLASLGNKLILKSSMPTAKQVALWNRLMVPISQLLDPILGYSLGKSVLGIWRRRGPAEAPSRANR